MLSSLERDPIFIVCKFAKLTTKAAAVADATANASKSFELDDRHCNMCIICATHALMIL